MYILYFVTRPSPTPPMTSSSTRSPNDTNFLVDRNIPFLTIHDVCMFHLQKMNLLEIAFSMIDDMCEFSIEILLVCNTRVLIRRFESSENFVKIACLSLWSIIVGSSSANRSIAVSTFPLSSIRNDLASNVFLRGMNCVYNTIPEVRVASWPQGTQRNSEIKQMFNSQSALSTRTTKRAL